MDNQLQVLVNQSGLEATKAQVILEKFQDYFAIASEWEKKAKTLVVTDEKQTAEMQMARTGRLFLREKRIAIEKARKERQAVEKKARIERERIEAERAEEARKAREVKERQEAKLANERAKVEADKKKAEEKARKEKEAERKEKERLAELLKNQVTCPSCGHKFQRKEGK